MMLVSNTVPDQDVLYHGSPIHGLQLIEPRQASDAEGVDFNIDMAVFATHHKAFAMIFGLVNREVLPLGENANTWSVGMRQSATGLVVVARIPALWRDHIEASAKGYLYLLPKHVFSETDGLQWKSKTAVEPDEMQVVTLADYIAAGGEVEWT